MVGVFYFPQILVTLVQVELVLQRMTFANLIQNRDDGEKVMLLNKNN